MLPLKNTSWPVAADCPADEDLREMLDGSVEEPDSSLVSHLDGCRHCRWFHVRGLSAGHRSSD